MNVYFVLKKHGGDLKMTQICGVNIRSGIGNLMPLLKEGHKTLGLHAPELLRIIRASKKQ
ncbi:hypothetical protein TUM17577_02530 [Enterobacter asburiae]|uniref:Uncharacterized protein n=1 Tax=Enterobacter chengduensis TaxID=2494701 RepID=A0AAW3HLI9_9ENTR|nr:hypothetical protein SG71_04850 [Enterobacter chengduensis]OTW33221.1 hypothetical protein CAP57_20120 [Enterobacter kobei]GJL39044.1 hypothetical protein TUM17577_02530 [Enterobacter asburiae]